MEVEISEVDRRVCSSWWMARVISDGSDAFISVRICSISGRWDRTSFLTALCSARR